MPARCASIRGGSRRSPAILRSLVIGGLALAACTPSSPGTAAPPAHVYVANGVDQTIVALDGERGTLAGPVLPAGMAPRQVVAGPNGSLLAVSTEGGAAGLRYIEPAGSDWLSVPVPLEAGASEVLLAADGVGRAAVAYHVPRNVPNVSAVPRLLPSRGGAAALNQPTRPLACRLALLDGRSGNVDSTLTACGVGETVTGLALAADPAMPVVYLAIRDDASPRFFTSAEGRHRVVAMNGRSGAILATYVLAGAPTHLTAAPPAQGRPRWLYILQEPPRSTRATTLGVPALVAERQLLRLRPDTLEVDRTIPVGAPVDAMDVAHDGTVYLLQGETVSRVVAATGALQAVAHLPGPGHALAVTPRWVFVTNPEGGEVWAVERRSGRLTRRIATGREPLGISVILS